MLDISSIHNNNEGIEELLSKVISSTTVLEPMLGVRKTRKAVVGGQVSVILYVSDAVSITRAWKPMW